MTILSPAGVHDSESTLKINGRLILQEDFRSRFQAMCSSLGLSNVVLPDAENWASSPSAQGQHEAAADIAIMLSCKVNYNPSWGVLGDHPQLLTQTRPGDGEYCPAGFLAPFLRLYQRAQQQIYLTVSGGGDCFVSVPSIFLECEEEKQGCHLHLLLDRVAEAGENRAIIPVDHCGTRFLYKVSNDFLEALHASNFAWRPGRRIPIGPHLTRDLFIYGCSGNAVDRKSPFFTTLFPYLRELVTHETPHLRAAEIHLRQEYSRTIAHLTEEKGAVRRKLACVAGIVIDMTSLVGHEEKYFVPWRAYLEKTEGQHQKRCSLDQDDLFVKLMH